MNGWKNAIRNASLSVAVLSGVMMFAQAAPAHAQSAAAFQPLTPTDAPAIKHSGYAVYSTDTSASRSVIADYGVSTAGSGGTTYSFSVGGFNNGGSLTCTAYAISLTSPFPGVTGTTVTTTVTGGFTLTPAVTVTSGGNYAVAIACTLPKSNGSGNGTIFGVWP